MEKLLTFLIKGYQNFIGPFLPRVCRYHPSCSQYALEAIAAYGIFKGGIMAGLRILRCNPFFAGGYDPVKREMGDHRLKTGLEK
ncbi:MAG: membrane protein insertion efficiency factor YidD [candidate division WOR-3 bacterium]